LCNILICMDPSYEIIAAQSSHYPFVQVYQFLRADGVSIYRCRRQRINFAYGVFEIFIIFFLSQKQYHSGFGSLDRLCAWRSIELTKNSEA
jgi:hypothetical protein